MGKIIDADDAIKAIQGLHRWILDPKGEFQPVDPPTISMINPDDAINAIENLQTTISDIIYCHECKYGIHSGYGDTYLCNVSPELISAHGGDFFCGYAKRRKDGILD